MNLTSDLMTPVPIAVRPSTPVDVCAREMARHAIGHLPVCDTEGRLLGVVPDHRVFRHGRLVRTHGERWVPSQPGAARPLAKDLMEPVEAVVAPDDTLYATMRLLLASPQDVAVVTNRTHEIVGILTEHDGVRMAAARLAETGQTVSSHSTRPVVSTRLDESGRTALERMEQDDIRHLLVLDEDRRIAGVVSWWDLMSDGVRVKPHLQIGDLMRIGTLFSTRMGEPIHHAAHRMMVRNVGCLPVLDAQDRAIGMLTRHDVISAWVQHRATFALHRVPLWAAS